MRKLLLCDDEEPVCRSLARLLRSIEFDVVTADGVQGLERLANDSFDVVLTDLRMPNVTGFDIIGASRRNNPHTPVIVMSGSAEIADAVRAMRAGARDFLIKPVAFKALEEVLEAVLANDARTPAPVPDPLAWRDRVAPWLLGRDPAVAPVLSLLSQVSDTKATVLITGESGTGKELVARSIVAGSPRANKAYVAVNCAAIPTSLVESELFGHKRGAFTDAKTDRTGRFQQADGGTIFLDEIGEMELAVQAKLLRLIQDGELYPVGEEEPQRIDVRILAATNRNLEEEVARGRFRADLFWRLNVIPIQMPALRERPSDIPLLAEHFLHRANQHHRRTVVGVDPEAMATLKRHAWPGNIRELENLIERLVIMKGAGVIGYQDLPPAIRNATAAARDLSLTPVQGLTPVHPAMAGIPQLPTDGADLRTILEAVEDRMISEALERTGGNKNKAAELLGLNRTTLVEKLRRKRLTPTVS